MNDARFRRAVVVTDAALILVVSRTGFFGTLFMRGAREPVEKRVVRPPVRFRSVVR